MFFISIGHAKVVCKSYICLYMLVISELLTNYIGRILFGTDPPRLYIFIYELPEDKKKLILGVEPISFLLFNLFLLNNNQSYKEL